MFLYKKLIDRSTLRQGFQIPVEFHHLLKEMPGGMPLHGEVCLSRDMFNLIYHLVLYHTCSKTAVKKRNNKHIENMSL